MRYAHAAALWLALPHVHWYPVRSHYFVPKKQNKNQIRFLYLARSNPSSSMQRWKDQNIWSVAPMKENANTPFVYPSNNNRVYIKLDTYSLARVERGGKVPVRHVKNMFLRNDMSDTKKSIFIWSSPCCLSLEGSGALAGAGHGEGGDGERGRREQAGERRHDPRAGVGLHGRLVLACRRERR